MGLEKVTFRAAPDKPEGGPQKTESTETSSQAIYFDSVASLKRDLIPWMRRVGLEKLSVYAYEGDTQNQLGHFIVSHERGHTELIDVDNNHISLFGATLKRFSSKGIHRGPRRLSRGTLRIEQWLQEKGCHPQQATFDIFPYESGDEQVTEQEAERHDVETASAPSEGEPSVPTEGGTAIAEEQGTAKPIEESVPEPKVERREKVKGPRKPRRRKPIKAERKGRLREKAENKFEQHLDALRSRVHDISSVHPGTLDAAHESFSGLMGLLQAHPEYKPRFFSLLTTNSQYGEIRAFVSLFRDDPLVPRSAKLPASYRYARKLARELYQESDHIDPYRSHESMLMHMITDRNIGQYMTTLFLDVPQDDPFAFLSYLHSRRKERWLDVGSGETYRVPDSLMNLLPLMNPNITLVGLDPLYDEKTASVVDRARGRHKLDQEWASRNQLVAGTAQDMKFERASFDQVLSLFAFDKFNEATEGTPQALRQLARVLKVGGIARIHGLDLSALEPGSLLHTYFTVQQMIMVVPSQDVGGKSFANVILVRKQVSADTEHKLDTDIEAWLRKYTPVEPGGK